MPLPPLLNSERKSGSLTSPGGKGRTTNVAVRTGTIWPPPIFYHQSSSYDGTYCDLHFQGAFQIRRVHDCETKRSAERHEQLLRRLRRADDLGREAVFSQFRLMTACRRDGRFGPLSRDRIMEWRIGWRLIGCALCDGFTGLNGLQARIDGDYWDRSGPRRRDVRGQCHRTVPSSVWSASNRSYGDDWDRQIRQSLFLLNLPLLPLFGRASLEFAVLDTFGFGDEQWPILG